MFIFRGLFDYRLSSLGRNGTGDNVKLTDSFPGFGQKKLIEKFADLKKA